MAQRHRHTIFDKMDYDGVFDKNPANINSRDQDGRSMYKGPQEFPKMLYHPKGEERIVRPGEAVMTHFGPKMVGEEKQLISRTVETKEEELELLKAGWHSRPRDAIKARAEITGEEVVFAPESVQETELDVLRKKLEAAEVRNAELELAAASGGKVLPPVKK